MSAARPPIVAITGGYLTANKGGAAMTLAVHDHVRRRHGSTRLLTIYPEVDRAQRIANLDVVSWKPLDLLVALPFALLIGAARTLRLPHRPLALTKGLRALLDADVVVDVAGISFVDGRGLPILGYNLLMTGIPLLVGTPVVKASQAVGPFEQRLNRVAARIVLPRVRAICARGDRTEMHLRDLGLTNVRAAADLAFVLAISTEAQEAAAAVIAATVGDHAFVTVAPSSVVLGYCEERGIDYIGALAALCRQVIHDGREVLIVAHSIHPSGREGRMHDTPVCRALAAAVAHERCHLLEAELGPAELRTVIEGGDALVSSRFHAMISGLSTLTPTLVMGWSHKYAEVLRAFGLEHCAVDYADIDADRLSTRIVELLAEAPATREAIEKGLPAVQASARGNLAAIDEALQRNVA